MDDFGNFVLVAVAIISKQSEVEISAVLGAIAAAARKDMPTFRPGCFIVDDCQAEINAIRFDFPLDDLSCQIVRTCLPFVNFIASFLPQLVAYEQLS